MALLISDFKTGRKTTELNTAFLFPGSGVELSGHEKTFYENHTDFCTPFAQICKARTTLQLESVLYADEKTSFNDLEMQYFTYTFSAIIASYLCSQGIYPKLNGGYSMGLYCAAYTSGCISFETGLDIIKIAYETLDEAYGKRNGGLYAIVGLTKEEISEFDDKERWPSIALSVVSSEASLVYSGILEELKDFAETCESKGAYKTVRLNADFPYHNPALKNRVPEIFSNKIDKMVFNDSSRDLFSTFTYKTIKSPTEFKREITDHLYTPISWLALLQKVHSNAFDVAIECGPGLTLTQISRFVPDRIKYWNIRNMEGQIRKL